MIGNFLAVTLKVERERERFKSSTKIARRCIRSVSRKVFGIMTGWDPSVCNPNIDIIFDCWTFYKYPSSSKCLEYVHLPYDHSVPKICR